MNPLFQQYYITYIYIKILCAVICFVWRGFCLVPKVKYSIQERSRYEVTDLLLFTLLIHIYYFIMSKLITFYSLISNLILLEIIELRKSLSTILLNRYMYNFCDLLLDNCVYTNTVCTQVYFSLLCFNKYIIFQIHSSSLFK